ncbi:hypothetical protein SVA_2535 [Sulfurifustis variabilis]|uniref:Transcriptional regulator n=1 Tax=Sulfurifustis variabilis TaxID=1675686 RepID=A0A1B4V685_9GAMM|nr:hypothetical protein [Sulfurifustis variabilis]BAU49083.1 hypothetical protein SVA_2535 [Sulfurifustis variabilis]
MSDADFPDELCRFIEDTIPTIETAELLLCLARHPEREWSPEELAHEIRPTVITEAAARKSLALFSARGLVVEKQGDRVRFNPSSADGAIRALAKAYNERPVTLIRWIYSLKEKKIQSFADAFKIKKD